MPEKRGASRDVTVVVAASAIAVLVGIAPLPYGYYMLLRLLLCAAALYLLLGVKVSLQDWQRWALGTTAVLYNPLLPVHLGNKRLWILLNVLTVVLFWIVRSTHSASTKDQGNE